MNPAIEVKGLSKSFPGVQALKNIDLTIRTGEVHALIGQNGAGKSTLIKIMAGAFPPSEGTLLVHGEPVRFSEPLDAIRRGIVTISQETNLVPTLSASENIFIGRLPLRSGKRVDWALMRRESSRLLDELGFPLDPDTKAAELSVAQQQGVEIARALSREADIVIMDEPTSALAAREVERLLKAVDQLKARGRTIIYVSHRFDEVFRLADRMSVFREGMHVATLDASSTNRDALVELMIGRAMTAPTARRAQVVCSSAPVLAVEGIGRAGVFEDISFSLHAGEILALSGLVGSGRTEIVRAIFGADKLDTGRIMIDGKVVPQPRPNKMVALGLALAPEDRKRHGLVLQMPVMDNLSLASIARRAGIYIRRFGAEVSAGRRYVKELSIRTPRLSTPVINLSGGNQQKVVIGKWLETKPRILIVDEPTRGIDIAAKADIFEILKALADDGMAIIMISSEQSEILQVADRTIVIGEGRFVAEFTKEEASEAKLTQAAFGRLPPTIHEEPAT
ncbi:MULTISPECIES: sugar ABC transporter ATP-binding protein [unclassified Mesorhizobium]|uniref:sugar ABC transporter ATP-binding protein n=1 Tax=unclassified Mesorhizobium TaxID=325217 RepID=UPI0015E2F84B|nr:MULTISPECIES: sugar ABC transporter ATP-binding protein [unclassified Mesorhizobium]MBZ9811290.1 sugar ABC transporter ATP-binding protein [Mesorhizobium sp. ESP-6-2]